ncbi:hypothetical protein L0U85_00040 [Glycomyces sp. L485]|uniref:hypothetical protein n=1 Tax=Glycomyces sp. L485 TaxID=2909235 RepID=UPI001F4BCC1D|nr:hypothetical protein [Glycomyces sp. L485]MCH7229263.1 hypothetical protein [Glycomyces sp. L485]
MRKATLVGGIATGALLLTGTAAQAAEVDVDDAGTDAVQSTPEMLGGLPIPTDAAPGLNSVVPPQALPAPALDNEVDNTVNRTGHRVDQTVDQTDTQVDRGQLAAPETATPADELLGNLGGGLPAPLPF